MLKKLYMIILVISLIVVGIVAFDRIGVESAHKTVEMSLDYEEAKLLADQSEYDLDYWLKHFKSLGFTSVAVKESTLENLKADQKPIEYQVMAKFTEDIHWESRVSDQVAEYIRTSTDKFDMLVLTESKEWYDFIIEGLTERYPQTFFKGFEGEGYAIVLDGEPQEGLYAETGYLVDEEGEGKRTLRKLADSKLSWIGLGFDEEIIKQVQASGLEVLPRPSNFDRHPDKLVKAFENEMKAFNITPDYFVFQGESVLGYNPKTEDLDKIYTYMKENHISTGLIETGVQRSQVKQDGLVKLTEMLDYDGIRVFPVVGYIQERYQWYGYKGAEEIENTIYRAVTERNIRSVYFRPFRDKDNEIIYITDPEIYTESFESLQKRLAEHKISLGNASKLAYNEPGVINLCVIGYGLVVLGIIALNSLFPMREKLQALLLSIGVLGITGANFVVPNLSVVIMALGASVLFPTLAAIAMMDVLKQFLVNRQIDKMQNIILKGLSLLLIVASIAMVGGIFVGSILSSSAYLLEMEFFRGVKVSQLAPLALFCVIYILRFGYDRPVRDMNENETYILDLKALVNERIKVLHLLILGLVGLLGVVYIARTGHETTIQPSNLEMLFRNFLEYNFLARPRSKELLLAFPAVMVVSYFALKGWKSLVFPFAAVVMIGVTSVVNTFSHLRAPLYLSIARTIYGAGLGALIGIIGILVINVLVRVLVNLRGRYLDE